MSPRLQSRSRTAMQFLFGEFPQSLEHLYCSDMAIPEDVVHCPSLTTITVGNNCLNRQNMEPTLQVLCEMVHLTSLSFVSCFQQRIPMIHIPSTDSPDDDSIALSDVQTITFAYITVEDASRILSSLLLPRLSSVIFNNIGMLHRPGRDAIEDIYHPDLQRVIDQGIFLQLSWDEQDLVYHFRALLFDGHCPTWREVDTGSLKASFTFFECDNSADDPNPDPVMPKYPHPLLNFFDTLAQFSFENVRVLNIIAPETFPFSNLPGLATEVLFNMCSSVTTLHLHNLNGTVIWERLAYVEEWGEFLYLCPSLTAMTLNCCEGNGLSLEQLLAVRKGMGHGLRYCEFRDLELSPVGFDLDLLVEYVDELMVF
ncbi:hypothetical protein SISNIDRAFT_460855 [Sistotremastrum niveocremeum HHB9708]|uniref:Uncharacterized protein n=1 Tax=Sistotremastrum niveocremeum HHB9708 TaxID=1314777 RepID=A0A164N8L4_9AGAM|nr:hypothetical protein SISNIDRAFT_460855 [Sistotremastrum niveocremeum HHB9708]